MKINAYSIGLAAVAILGGLGLVCGGAWFAAAALGSTAWPQTEGEVIATRVVERARVSPEVDISNEFEPVISYSYRVDGESYTGDRIDLSLSLSFSTPGEAQAVLDRYPIGSRVQVYYEPGNPDNAALETGMALSTFIPFCSGIFIFLGGAYLAFTMLRQKSTS